MTDLAVFVIALTGFALLFLAKPRHQQDWLNARLSSAAGRGLRLAGAALIVASFVIDGLVLGWGYGSVCWFGWLTLAAILVVALNSNRARLLRWVGRDRP